jgi:hypothetical protein
LIGVECDWGNWVSGDGGRKRRIGRNGGGSVCKSSFYKDCSVIRTEFVHELVLVLVIVVLVVVVVVIVLLVIVVILVLVLLVVLVVEIMSYTLLIGVVVSIYF